MENMTNPWMIMGINMTIVFAVLISLGVLMKIVYYIDPTRVKKEEKAEAPKAAAPAPAPAAKPVSAPSPKPVVKKNDDEIVAVIAAVVAMGYSASQVASVRPIKSKKWAYNGRLSGRM